MLALTEGLKTQESRGERAADNSRLQVGVQSKGSDQGWEFRGCSEKPALTAAAHQSFTRRRVES